jgi:uncharacterized protein
MKVILIRAGSLSMEAELNDNPTAELIWNALPIEGRANRWGDEIYFSIPVKTGSESSAHEDVEIGDLGYWPPGNAFCIFFGSTPVSHGSKPRAASPVNIFGKVRGDATCFRAVHDGDKVIIEESAKIV